MNVITVADAAPSLFARITAPALNLCDALAHTTSALNHLAATADSAAKRLNRLVELSMDDQEAELLARRQQRLQIN